MVVLNRIYTRTGDDGTTSLGSGARRKKYDLRVDAYGTLDEVNAALGIVRLHTAGDAVLDPALARIQNDLFDVEADLCMPSETGKGPGGARLTVTDAQVDWLERQIDILNEDLAPLKGDTATPQARVYEKKVDAQGRAYATGKRKDAVARVWVKRGGGKITINGRDQTVYFARPVLQMILNQPLVAAKREDQFDIVCTVSGGGLSGQAGAVRHGISKALTRFEPELRGVLKKGGFLTRDARTVERKKYGKAKARKSFQFSKR